MSLKSLMQNVKNFVFQENQPIFTQDWFSANIDNWKTWLSPLTSKPNLQFLEIGSYEGRSTRWLLENILTHTASKIYCIDTFKGGIEHDENQMIYVKENFYHNIWPYRKKVCVFEDFSHKVIRNNPTIFPYNFFDFIYIDGSHQARDVLEDAVLSFRLLKKGGTLIFDDYEWELYEDTKLNPKMAIDAWLACFEDEFELIYKGWQVCVKKLVESV